ncbi:cytohesin-1 isoform X1 [Labeo rohita]|uniref:Cytohesin-1 isoform X1 n=1 Tax=Labeo rohita TaxID=84645 RepID=A0A498MTP8_LABRO|nr:cytohesin-1 isoform X1 [Labeo rohita]
MYNFLLCSENVLIFWIRVPDDLTPEEKQELENIRRRKQELLEDIQRLKDEITKVTNEIESLGSTQERINMQRSKQMAMGRKKFNMDPKKGIQFLIENELLKNTCEDIAQFLYKGEGLNKTAIGDYLGERDDFNIQVLHAFVELHEFTDLNLVQALRQFLWSFRLPGEAQKIDRMMEAFAQRYCQCNPGVFQSTDTCYVLSFAIIMLNTSLHNPNVKDKPSAERFIGMNRGINDGGDLPEDLLRNLYESIKNEPFKIPEDDGNDLTHTFFNPDREGWLLKLGGRVKTWKRRWFILTDNCLYYFEYTTDKEPRGIIPLENLSIREVDDSKKPVSFLSLFHLCVLTLSYFVVSGRVKTWKRRWFILTDNCLYYFEYTTDKEPRGIIPLENLSIREVDDSKKPNCFELFIPDNKDQVIKACKTEADGRVVEGNHTFYRISAPTTEEKDEWIKSIKAAISRDPFYEMLAARKKKASSLKRQ